MILNKLEDFTNAILRGEEIKHETVFYTGELDEVTSPEIGGEYKVNGQKVGVVAAFLNGKTIVISKKDEPEEMNWSEAVEIKRDGWRCPTKTEWLAISDNFEKVNEGLERVGGEPLEDKYYWSSSESTSNGDTGAWVVRPSDGTMGYGYKHGSYRVRCVLAL